MVQVLADVHVLESVLQFERNRKGTLAVPASVRYQQLFSGLGISRKRFSQNLAYYQSDPEEFAKMYSEVVAELEKRKSRRKLQ